MAPKEHKRPSTKKTLATLASTRVEILLEERRNAASTARPAKEKSISLSAGSRAAEAMRFQRLAARDLKIYLVFLVVLLCAAFVGRRVHGQFFVADALDNYLNQQKPVYDTIK